MNGRIHPESGSGSLPGHGWIGALFSVGWKNRCSTCAKEIADLTLAVAAINAWNRFVIAGRVTPGNYQAPVREQRKTA